MDGAFTPSRRTSLAGAVLFALAGVLLGTAAGAAATSGEGSIEVVDSIVLKCAAGKRRGRGTELPRGDLAPRC